MNAVLAFILLSPQLYFLPKTSVTLQAANREAGSPYLSLQTGHAERIVSVAFSLDGKTIASGSTDGIIKLWDTQTGILRYSVGGGSGSLAFLPDRVRFAGIEKGDVWIRDARSGALIQVLKGDGGQLTSLACMCDGSMLAAGSWDRTIKRWDLQSGKLLSPLEGHTGQVFGVAFSPIDRALVSGGINDSRLRLWDPVHETSTAFEKHVSVSSLAFSPDGHNIAIGPFESTAGQVRLWDILDGGTRQLVGHRFGDIRFVAFSPDGKFLASGATGWGQGDPVPEVLVWDIGSGKPVPILDGQVGELGGLAYSPDGHSLAVAVGTRVFVWDVQKRILKPIGTPDQQGIHTMAISPSGEIVAVGIGQEGKWGAIELFDVRSGRRTHRLVGHRSWVFALAFSPDGEFLASADRSGTAPEILLWSLKHLNGPRKRIQASLDVESLSFSLDGRLLAVAGWGRASSPDMYVLKTDNWHRITTRAHANGLVHAVALSPKGQLVAWTDYVFVNGIPHGIVRVWDLRRDTLIWSGEGHRGPIWCLAFSPDGRYIASGGVILKQVPNGLGGETVGGEVLLWQTAKCGTRHIVLEHHRGSVRGLCFSRDGRFLASGSYDGTALVWNWAAGLPICATSQRGTVVVGAGFTAYSSIIATAHGDGQIRLWKRSVAEKGQGRELASLVSVGPDGWVVAAPTGRFDTSNIDQVTGVNWVFPDDPFTPLSPEVFMRHYYEPRLLPRLLKDEALAPIPPLASLNRVQPLVSISSVTADGPNTVAVTVQVQNQSRQYGDYTYPIWSGGKDLRLFRDGQLVAAYPDTATGGVFMQGSMPGTNGLFPPIVPSTATFEHTFHAIHLPRRAGIKQVFFTAYAFNTSDVKSQTSQPVVCALGGESSSRHIYDVPAAAGR